MFGRLGVDLGSLLRVMLDSYWRLVRPEWVQDPSSNHLVIDEVIVHKICHFPSLFGKNGPQDGAKIDPKSHQEGSNIVLGRFLFVFNVRFDA